MLNSLKVAHKLSLGFGAMMILILVAILVGYRGIGSLDNALHIIADEEAPLVDTANRMNGALLEGRNAMELFKGTTTSLFDPDNTAIEASKTSFSTSVATFELLSDAILNGATLENGQEIIATKSPVLIEQIQVANKLHSEQFQVAANELFTVGSALVAAREQAGTTMLNMEKVVEGVITTADQLTKAANLELNKWKFSERGIQRLMDVGLNLIGQIKEMKVAIQQSRLALEEVAQSDAADEVNAAAADYNKSIDAFGPIIANMQTEFSSRGVSSSLRRLRNLHKQMKKSGDSMINAQLQLLDQAQQAQQSMSQLDNAGEQMAERIKQVVTIAIQEMDLAKQESQSASNQAVMWVVVVGLVAVAAGVLLGTLITRSITVPLGGEPAAMQKIARTIADGDLTQAFDEKASRDSVYGAMHEMSTNLRAMIGNIVESSTQLAATAEESSATTEHARNIIQEQHSETDQVATAINEMSATVQEIARNTSEVASATDEAKRQSDEGQRTLNGATQAIHQLVDQVSSAGQAMTVMHDKSLEIGQVLAVIQGIAEQTNLLALNAAIEAARAGEQGRGFAVVADEVRTLAQRTQSSASDIQKMIESVQSAASSATETMQQSQSQATQTSEHAAHTSEAFNGIKEAVEKIREMTLQVATASEEQSHVAEEVNRNITHIRELALQTSSSAEELAGASHEVASSAETLNGIAVQFKV